MFELLLHHQSMIDILIIVMPKSRLNPLPAAALQILMSLTDDDLHGYEIMRRVAEQTDGRTRLGPGTLYSSIQALLDADFIAEVGPRGEGGHDVAPSLLSPHRGGTEGRAR